MTYVRRITRAVLLLALAVICGACASMTRPASSERPRANDAPRFAVLAASDERRSAALAGWKTVVGEQAAAGSPVPELEPVTATLKGLPAALHDYPRLPLVVIKDARTQSEEETRESLRRFLSTAAPLLGTDLRQLSLVGVSDAPAAAGTGAKRALYQQNPFAYPLRNGYGVVDVTFTPDLRVVKLSSTAIPEAERLARTLNTVAKTLTAEQAVAALSNRPITYTDRGGTQQTRTVSQADSGVARQLVVFPIRRDADPATLELHIAWEVSVGSTDAPLLAYVDAATGDLLGASQGS